MCHALGLLQVRWLVLEAGVPVDQACVSGRKDRRNALHWAARNGHVAVCEWLWRPHREGGVEEDQGVVPAGINLDAATVDGTVAFHWAVWQGQFAVCRWLRDRGCDWRRVNDWGCNAVHWAALQGNLPMCRWLSSLGLDMALPNNQGHTALHKAAYKGHFALCRWLLQSTTLGAHRDGPVETDGDKRQCRCGVGFTRDAGGYTAGMIAREQGHAELSEWLDAVAAANYCTACASSSASVASCVPVDEQLQLVGPLGTLTLVSSKQRADVGDQGH